MPDFYDDPENWEWFEEIEDFKEELSTDGYSEWQAEEGGYDAHMLAWATAESRAEWLFYSGMARSRGPGNRVRDRYWDRQK